MSCTHILAPRLLQIRRGAIVVAGSGVSAYTSIQTEFSTVTDGERGDEGGEGFAAEILVRRPVFFVGKPDRASNRGFGRGEWEGREAGADGMRGTIEEKGPHDREANAGWGVVVLAKSKKGYRTGRTSLPMPM